VRRCDVTARRTSKEAAARAPARRRRPKGRLPPGGRPSRRGGGHLLHRAGETLGLVGESGCGKSPPARHRPSGAADRGLGLVQGTDLTGLDRRSLRSARTGIQMISRPISSLNPRRRVRDIVAEPSHLETRLERRARPDRARDAERRARPDVAPSATPRVLRWPVPAHLDRPSPRARAELLVCDEVVSPRRLGAGQILNLWRPEARYD